MSKFARVGLDALLTPENCVLILIDHQAFQLANVNGRRTDNDYQQRHRTRKDGKSF